VGARSANDPAYEGPTNRARYEAEAHDRGRIDDITFLGGPGAKRSEECAAHDCSDERAFATASTLPAPAQLNAVNSRPGENDASVVGAIDRKPLRVRGDEYSGPDMAGEVG
jgi:hypothetical protein